MSSRDGGRKPKRRRWKIGNCAGHHIWPNGDMSVSKWVTTPSGELKILTTLAGFRDKPGGGREKVILDRKIVDPPPGSLAGREGPPLDPGGDRGPA